MLLAAIALATSTPTDNIQSFTRPPAMDISAIRRIQCDHWSGSGFLIADGIMVTADHVMNGATGCVDQASGSKLLTYKTDKAHDLALVTGPGLPTDIPYVRISCSRFVTGEKYLAYGITSFAQPRSIVRNNVLTATADYTPKGYTFSDGMKVEGARYFIGYAAPGMSGGPVADINGYAHGLVTGGSAYFSVYYEFADGILCKN